LEVTETVVTLTNDQLDAQILIH